MFKYVQMSESTQKADEKFYIYADVTPYTHTHRQRGLKAYFMSSTFAEQPYAKQLFLHHSPFAPEALCTEMLLF